MIISHKHKFIFIKTKKTAGTSIEIALSRICGDLDIITPMNPEDEKLRKSVTGRGAQHTRIPFGRFSMRDWVRFLIRGKRAYFYNHITAKQVKRYVGSSIWNDYYTFCFERNPVTKSISHFKWRGAKVDLNSYQDYLHSPDVKLIQGAKFYTDGSGNLLVDKVYKMEQMQEAFDHLKQQINCTNLQVPEFKTKQSKAVEGLDAEHVEQHYKEMLEAIFKTEYDLLYR